MSASQLAAFTKQQQALREQYVGRVSNGGEEGMIEARRE